MKYIKEPHLQLWRDAPNPAIRCSSLVMAKCLGFLNSEPWEKYAPLVPSHWNPKPQTGECYLFRSGAKLSRNEGDLSYWWIYGYAAGGKDVVAAHVELKAAYLMYRAAAQLKALDDVLGTSKEHRIVPRGMWGLYPSGQRSPSALNPYDRLPRDQEELIVTTRSV